MAGVNDLVKRSGVRGTQEVFDAILAMTREGQDVRISGFGIFSKVHKEAREGRNPATGESLTIEAKDVLHFKATKGIDMSTPKSAGGGRRR